VSRLTDMLNEFHSRPGVDITAPPAPTLNVEGLKERQRFLQDEVDELRRALDDGDVVGYADALADIVYVVFGSAWRTGIGLDDVLEEVHASNMTKTPSPGDGKAIKGPGYRPPDIPAAFRRAAEHAAALQLRAGRPSDFPPAWFTPPGWRAP
jgi:predicted HAD superfamily Cof-like phosphohydrolase